ncbi:unnamed protein product [Prunus brigantina]
MPWTRAEKRPFLRQRVEARLASLLMESKEYSEALSLLSGLIKEVRRLDDKLLLVDIDLLETLSMYLIVFLSSLSSSMNLNTKLREKAFIARKRFDLSVTMVSQDQSKDSGSKKNGGKELRMVNPQDKSLKKMKFVSSAETEPGSTTTYSKDSKSGRGISTMPRVVKRKYQKIKPVVEYNKRGKGCGPAHTEMQSYIGVLARSRVPLVDKKWAEIPKDIKEQIWEAVDMAFLVGQGGKNLVLSFAAKKWKDFKSTLTRHHILPFIKEKEKLSQPPELYKFIEKAEWDAFVASRLSEQFVSSMQMCEIMTLSCLCIFNNHILGRNLSTVIDCLEKDMLVWRINWRKPCPEVEIDRSTLWKKARQDKHGNIPDPKVAEKAKLINIEVVDYSKLEVPSSLQSLCRYVEPTLKPQEKIMTFTIEKEVFGEDRSTFVLHEDITQFAGMEEIGATVVAVYMRCLFDNLKAANMLNMVGFIDHAQVSANIGSLTERSRLVANRLQKTDGEQIFMMPYNPGHHWVLFIVRAKKETVYFLNPMSGNRVVDEEAQNILNSAIKMYNSHIGRQGRKATIWKTLPGTPKQPSSVECGYFVMRFMRDIIMDPSLEFDKTFAKGKDQAPYPQATIDEVRKEWAEFVCLHME